jgi:hypothetical protein
MKFGVDNFRGMIPIHKSRKLPDGYAQNVLNIDLKATDLRPFRQNVNLGIVADNNMIQRSAFPFSYRQMFVFESYLNSTYGPIRYEEEKDNKVFIDSGHLGNNYPIYTSKELGIPVSPTSSYLGPPTLYRKLGVPAPPAQPTLVVEASKTGNITAVAGGLTTLADGVTRVEDAVIMWCSAPHGLESGQRVTLKGFDWSYYNNTFVIDAIWDTIGDHDLQFVLRGVKHSEVTAGVDDDGNPEPSVPGTGTWGQEFTAQQYEDRVYLYTFVTADGEEGAPSLPSILVTVGNGLAVTVGMTTDPEIDGVFVNSKRIYRTIPTSTGAADYYYVDEVPIAQETYVDTKNHIELGERLPSLEWYMPPEGLKGLIVLPNGVMMGFKGNQIIQSEPYQPHAYPESFKKTVDNPIVGLAAFAQHVVVATSENPYLATLSDPLTISFKKLDTVEPCSFRRSMVTFGYGVMYVSPNGLILVTANGAQNVLKGVWDPDDWKELIEASTDAYAVVHDEKYYLTFVDENLYIDAPPVATTYIFDPSESPLQITSLSEHSHSGACVDRDEDKLFFLGQQTGPLGPCVYQHDPEESAGTSRLAGTWLSGTFVMSYPCSMGAAQVMFEPSGFDLCQISFYIDGLHHYTVVVTDMEPFRLPGGFLGRDWSIQLYTDSEIHGVYVAETIEELRGAGAG